MASEVLLYDIPSRETKAWSLNPWKTRLALNYKGIPYKTEWTEYPDLEPTLKSLGLGPNKKGYGYTSPAVRLPSGLYLMESRIIADELETLQPEPSLHLDSPYQARIETLIDDFLPKCREIFAPLVPRMLLSPPSEKYYTESRERSFGKSLDEIGQGTEKAFEAAKGYVKQLGEMYKENEGPFLRGEEVCYADFVVVAWLKMMEMIGWKGRFEEIEGGEQLKRVYEASGKWLQRDT